MTEEVTFVIKINSRKNRNIKSFDDFYKVVLGGISPRHQPGNLLLPVKRRSAWEEFSGLQVDEDR
jgi:hypothetical protein